MTRLLLICAPAMDWAGFESRARAGEIPRLAALRARGVAGWLSGAPADVGPAAAVSLVTGVQPETHGVWRRQEAWNGGVRPVSQASWRSQPLWSRLEAGGVSTGGVGWPASRPGSAWPGVHLDEDFAESSGETAEAWALPLRCGPDEQRETVRGRRLHPSRITAAMIAPLVPPAAFDRPHRDGLRALTAGMAKAATIQSAAAWLLKDIGADAVFVFQPILRDARGAFDGGAEPVFDDVVPGAWRFLDGLVGRLAELTGPGSLVMVVSPGWRGAPGVCVAAGEGVDATVDFEGADLLDIAPTVLGRFGYEDRGLPGRRLPAIAVAEPLSPARSPRLQRGLMPDPRVMGPLKLLGYRPPARAPKAWKAAGLAELGWMMLDRDPSGAVKAADAALAEEPGCILALRVKVRGQVALQSPDGLDTLGDSLLRLAPERGWGPLAHGARHVLRRSAREASPWLNKAEADADPATLLTVATLWIAAGRIANAARVFGKILEVDPDNVTAEIGLAMAATARRDFMAAESGLHRARKQEPGRPAVWLQLAQVYARSGRKAEAARMADTARRLGAAPALAAAAAAGRLRV